MLAFCLECGMEVAAQVEHRAEPIPVKGTEYHVSVSVPVCSVCGTEAFVEELEEDAIQRAFDLYRKEHGLIFPNEIRELRELYGLTQKGLAVLLGWGDVTITRYENGSLPSRAHNDILMLLRRPSTILEFVERGKHRIGMEEYNRLCQQIREAFPDNSSRLEREVFRLEEAVGREADIFHGDRRFSFSKLANMGVYFAARATCYKVKFMKLLWFADFVAYKRLGRSISGLPYVALPMGPVPDEYRWLMSLLEEEGWVAVEPAFEVGERIIAEREPSIEMFAEEENRVLQSVLQELGSLSTDEIVDLSHKEDAWQRTYPGERISYTFAKDLRAL